MLHITKFDKEKVEYKTYACYELDIQRKFPFILITLIILDYLIISIIFWGEFVRKNNRKNRGPLNPTDPDFSDFCEFSPSYILGLSTRPSSSLVETVMQKGRR